MAAYELMLDRCSTAWASWLVIPSDHKWARNAAIAAIVRKTLEAMNPRYPKPDWDPKSFVIE
jgi:polyphosphate kinase 2 (PPK2 family)